MKKVYVCSPYRGDVETNRCRAIVYRQFTADQGCIPIVPHLALTDVFDDSIPEQRARGMAIGLALLKECDELWVFASHGISEGMQAEIEEAARLGIPARWLEGEIE